ncbi:hypothetical protein WAI453_009646 [Rhynchosporium graminicola]
MASTNQTTNPTEPASSLATPDPFLRPADPKVPVKELTQAELDLALIELTIEAAWNNTITLLKTAKTATERRKIRRQEMHVVNTVSETAGTRAAQEMLDGRIRLLEVGFELGEWEEKYWFSRL